MLERVLAALDNGKHGLCFSSGMGVITVITQLLKAGDHMISCFDVYGGTNCLFKCVKKLQGVEVDFVIATNLENIRSAVKPNTKVRKSDIDIVIVAYNSIQFN